MASDISYQTPLKTIVAYTSDELQKSQGDFDMMWLLGLRALTELNFDISAEPITVRLPVSANKTVPFPTFCLSWTKIGLMDHNGQINDLKINRALTTFRDNNPNRLSQITPDINSGINSLAVLPYYANFYYNSGVFQLFGLGGGMVTYGECNVDETNRVVILAPDFKYPDIMFECTTTPQKCGDYPVPTYLQEAVIMFIKWKLKMATAQDFYAEVTKARRRAPKKKFILQSFNQVIRESGGMYLKA